MKKSKNQDISVGFVALGCPKNVVDAEKMLATIGQAGFVLSSDADNCDVIIVNTCGFIEPAKDEAIDEIANAIELKNQGRVKKVIVTGCLAQRMGESLREEVEGIDAIVGLGQRDDIAWIIKETLQSPQSYSAYMESVSEETELDDSARLLVTPPHRAYLRISEGCDRKCAFCTIPQIRGKFRSKPAKNIISEARELVENGAVELSIIAQDSNYYARDLNTNNGLIDLLTDLDKIDPLKWIRLMYLYPAEISDQLIERIAASSKIVNYIDMPIQHISDDILRAMRRADRRESTVSLVEKLRVAMPDVALRTTVIAGLPGETEEHFQELLDFIKWARFDALGCFTYYPEPGTAAAEMPDQVPEDVKSQRADAIMLAQQQIAFEKTKNMKGQTIDCLIDAMDANTGVARHFGQAPEIDSVCIIENCKAKTGDMIKAKITGADEYDLLAKQI
jgi:ribosomal protein S12 methylthiotransferase